MITNHPNPYIGPRTFRKEEGHLFFGRDREAADLEALVASEKLVLFYAQSGAGKSSLINARLIPRLEKKLYEVLPVVRLAGDAPVDAEAGNIYIFNLFRSLHRRESDPKLFRSLTLSHFLKKLNEDQDGYFYDPDQIQSLRDPKPWPRLLIIDQFEELFSTNVEAWQQREEFFRQLAQAMQDDLLLWVLLVMREDYIAALDPYAYLLPKGFRVRYYMERLSHEAAIKAIRSPVEGRRPYAEGVAEKLAEDLSRVKVQKPDGTTGTEPGQYIEPVQLQVVCYSLWENLTPGGGITEQDLQAVGDVNQSLARYYDQRVTEVASTKNVSERRIRDWFDQKLIMAGGIRGMVLQERETPPGGLDDEVIQALQSDLVREEKRGGATWYELTHDRLVEPILASNKKWIEDHLSPFQRQALLWEDQKKSDNWLLTDSAYTEIESWVSEHRNELTDLEKEFLEESRKKLDLEYERRTEQENHARRLRILAIGATTSTILALILLAFTILFAVQANRQAKISRVGELAAQSVALRDKNFLVSLLLGVEAFKGTSKWIPSVHAQSALLENTEADPKLEQFLNGNAGPVVSVAFSPDGKTLAFESYDHDILLLDVKTRQPIGRLSGHSDIVKSLAFNPDGGMLASGSDDKTIILWDMKTQPPIGKPLTGHLDVLTSVAFSPDGNTLATCSYDKNVILWDVITGQPLKKLSGHTGKVRSVTFSPDGNTLASSGDDGTIILWDVKTGEPTGKPLNKPVDSVLNTPNPVLSIAFSPDGSTLASGNYDKNVILWDVKTGQPLKNLNGHSDIVRTVAFSPDGKTLASGSEDRTIILWDVENGQLLDQLRGHSDLINSVSFSPDGNTLASGSKDKTVVLWDVKAHQPISRPLSGYIHPAPIRSIAFSPDGNTLASGSYDTSIMLWDVEKGKGQAFKDKSLFEQKYVASSIAFSPDGKILALGGEDHTFMLWDVAKHRVIDQTLQGHTGAVTSIAFSPDGNTLAPGSCGKFDGDTCVQGEIILWDMKTRQPIGKPFTGHSKEVTNIAFSPDGRMLASGSEDTNIILWDVKTGRIIGEQLSGHTEAIKGLLFSPDGKTLASGSHDSTVILWDVKNHQAIVTLSGHSGPILSVAFSPDGKTLASGSLDRTIILWDVQTHQPIGQPLQHIGQLLRGQSSPVQSVAFSPDGKTLASSSLDIILWDLNEKSWINEACQRAGRNFTRKEWELYFPREEYRETCPEFPLEPAATPTATP